LARARRQSCREVVATAPHRAARAPGSLDPDPSRCEGAARLANSNGQKTIIGVFRQEHEAEKAVRQLRDEGFSDKEVSLIGPDSRKNGQGGNANHGHDGPHLSSGATWGAGIGGGLGLLAGAGALAIPGFGPLLAMGPLAAALTGAAAGGITGSLTDWGIPEQEAKRVEEDVKRGEFLAVVRTDHDAQKAERTLRDCGAHDVDMR
jgi:uncharacterized membrane protein